LSFLKNIFLHFDLADIYIFNTTNLSNYKRNDSRPRRRNLFKCILINLHLELTFTKLCMYLLHSYLSDRNNLKMWGGKEGKMHLQGVGGREALALGIG
jgi:hypothetical protein